MRRFVWTTFALALAFALLAAPLAPIAAQQTLPNTSTLIAESKPGQWRWSDYKNLRVYGPGDKLLGRADDLLIGESGEVVSVVLKVSDSMLDTLFDIDTNKRVAVPLKYLRIVQGRAYRMSTSITYGQLVDAPPFKFIRWESPR